MGMPKNLVLIRHGQSEANIVQGFMKDDPNYTRPEEFYTRHDSLMRLSPRGVEQAQAAGNWLRANNLAHFDRFYVSPHVRTCETAANLQLGGQWIKDDRWRERDWGEYGVLDEGERLKLFPHSANLKHINEWYWCPPGGESLATGVRERVTNIFGTLHREAEEQDVIGVTHGETLRVFQFLLERHTPGEWLEMDENPEYKMQNCQILHYTRINPETGELNRKIKWMRSICPWDESKSWNNGEWVELNRFTYSDAELLEGVNNLPRLLDIPTE